MAPRLSQRTAEVSGRHAERPRLAVVTTTRTILATTLLLGALAACGDGGEPPARQGAEPLPDAISTTVSASAAPTTATPAPTTAPATATTTAAPTPSTAPPTSAATPTAVPTFPPAVTAPRQGGRYVAVFLAVTRAGEKDSAEKTAIKDAAKAGYTVKDGEVGRGDIDCTRGARAALRLDATADYMAVSVLFAAPAQAASFVAAYEPAVVGTAPVQTYCLD
jgi:cytoskeletal protein RodZ